MANLVGHKLAQRLLKADCAIAEEFSQKLWAQVQGSLEEYIKFNRANFVLLAMVNGVDKDVSRQLLDALKEFDASAATGKGWEILQEKMGRAPATSADKKAPASKKGAKGTDTSKKAKKKKAARGQGVPACDAAGGAE